MKDDLFSIENFNVISDEEYYYVFRALNSGDHRDIEEQKITEDGERLVRIRTDRERWEEQNDKVSKYAESKEASVEEIISHCKAFDHSKETNCISLTSNANIVLNYGEGYNNEYVMVKIPKNSSEGFIEAGKFLLEELDEKINERISELDINSELYTQLERMNSQNKKEIVESVISTFTKVKSEGKYTGKNALKDKTSIYSRFDDKQIFSEEQQRKFQEIIGKLTLLELHGKFEPVLNNTRDNSLYLKTMATIFSNTEILHYNSLEAKDFISVSRSIIDMFALIQQVGDKDRENEQIKAIERKILELAQKGYDVKEKDEKLVFTNGKDDIDISQVDISKFNGNTFDETQIDIEYIYRLTDGKIPYEKAKEYMEFSHKLGEARQKAQEFARILDIVCDDDNFEEIINKIFNEGFVINKDIIRRQDGKGIQISESVNIDGNKGLKNTLSQKEQERIVSQIREMTKEELEQFVEYGEIKLGNRLMEILSASDEKKTENTYFAEAIVDSMDFSKIYKNAITEDRKKMKDSERETLIQKLEVADCKRLYNAFKEAGVKHEEIAGYIVNLLINNGYKGYDFKSLSKVDNLNEIIITNVKNTMLKSKVVPFRLEELLNNKDNENLVDGTNIKLRDYQKETIDNLDEIYKTKNFAGVVLPTGAGKSFVAITEMLKFKDKNIIYFAPQTEILNQIQRHILKNVLGVQVLTKKEIDELNGKEPPEGKIYPKDIDGYISKAFPHLKMYCYQSLAEKDNETKDKVLRKILANSNADFMVFDELHRTGAETWEPLIQELIQKNKDAKILGITATPVRDSDNKDMMYTLAKFSGSYSQEELMNGEYLAKEMTLVDAIQDHLVVEPKIVTFNYSLGDTEEYKEIRKMYNAEKDPVKKKELKKILNQMNDIINDTSDIQNMIENEADPEKRKLLEEHFANIRKNLNAKEMQGIGEVITQNIVKKDGRYIVFLPQNNTKLSTEEYVKKEIDKVKEYIKDIDIEPEIEYVLSEKNKKDNFEAISNFEDSTSEHIKLLFAIDKLNEGVHVDGINGEIMLRKIGEGSRILYLQQLGRVIYSLDPDNPVPEDEIPIVFDVYNNCLVQNMNKEVNKKNTTSDLQRLQTIVNWINKHGYIPDINSESLDEARKAINIKKIQLKYSKYIDGIENGNFSQKEINEIKKILELADSINLFEMEIPERIIPPGEKDLSEVQLFKVTGSQKKFLDLYKSARKITNTKKQNPKIRLRTTLSVLETLSEYGVVIDNGSIVANSTINDILNKLPVHIRDVILSEIDVPIDYEIGNEYNYAKKAFLDKNKMFLDYDVKDLRKCGILKPVLKEYLKENERPLRVVENGFIINGPNELIDLNIYTGTRYDENGYDKYGYDIEGYGIDGYDRSGWNKEGKNKTTDGLYDLGGFDRDGFDEDGWNRRKINRETGELYDKDGYDKEGYDKEGYNKQGWDRQGWNKEKKNSYTNQIYDYQGYDINGRDREGYDRNGIGLDGYDKEGFTRLGYDREGYNREGYDYEGRDRNGFDKNGYHKVTKRKFDEQGFNQQGLDRGGFDRNGLKNGRDREGYDKEGFDKQGYDRDGYNRQGWNRKGINKETGELYDENGYYMCGISICGYDRNGYKTDGRDRKKYDINGYDSRGYDRAGYNRKGYDKYGYNKEGYDKYGFDKRGYDIEGYNQDGYDREGFDKSGYNMFGWNREEKNIKTGELYDKEGYDINGFNRDGFNRIGYDKEGYDRDGYNRHGWNRDRKNKETGELYDVNGYDIFGYDKDGFNERGYNRERYDRDGFNEWGRNKEGYDREGFNWGGYDKEGYDRDGYNRHGWNRDRKNKETGELYDVNGYDIDGYDKNGWNRDGLSKTTGEIYDDKGYDKNGNSKEKDTQLALEFIKSGKWIRDFCSGKQITELHKSIDILRKVAPEMEEKIQEALKREPKKQSSQEMLSDIRKEKEKYYAMKKSGKYSTQTLNRMAKQINEKLAKYRKRKCEEEEELKNKINENETIIAENERKIKNELVGVIIDEQRKTKLQQSEIDSINKKGKGTYGE